MIDDGVKPRSIAGGVDDRLEGRPELAVGLHRAVELAAAEAPAADHRLDLAGVVVDRRACAPSASGDCSSVTVAAPVAASSFVIATSIEIAGLEQIRRRRRAASTRSRPCRDPRAARRCAAARGPVFGAVTDHGRHDVARPRSARVHRSVLKPVDRCASRRRRCAAACASRGACRSARSPCSSALFARSCSAASSVVRDVEAVLVEHLRAVLLLEVLAHLLDEVRRDARAAGSAGRA